MYKGGQYEREEIVKIILVDDEVEFVSALAERLSLRGIEAEWVSCPEDAIAKVENECYALGILDMKMPRMDGITLKKSLQEKCPDMKFVFLTGHGCEETFRAGITEAGEDYYFLKPIRIEDLIARINEALGKK